MKLSNKHLGHHNCGNVSLTMAEIITHYRRQGYTKEQTGSIPFAELLANMTDEEITAAKFSEAELTAFKAGTLDMAKGAK